jgi:hypothetical protein
VPKSINLTPAGLQTPEGVERNAKACDAYSDTKAEACNLLLTMVKDAGGAEAFAKRLNDRGEYLCDPEDLKRIIDTHKRAEEEFLRSLAGAPPWKG